MVAGALGMETQLQFDRPYLASSLRDFWGRRCNLMVSAILRPSVYDPVRASAGGAAGILASFAASGVMHEAMVCYLSLRWMAAFFALHGVCWVAEGWCARRWAARRLPRAVSTAVAGLFVAGTSFWLFFPALLKDGRRGEVPGRVGCRGVLLPGRRREDEFHCRTVNGVILALASMKVITK